MTNAVVGNEDKECVLLYLHSLKLTNEVTYTMVKLGKAFFALLVFIPS